MTTRVDTLVVGAGSAGLFAALSFAENGSVILLETGPDAGTPPPDWALYDYALPDAHYHHYVDRRTGMAVPQGRGLGGGSTVNFAAALRGQPWCYDGWNVPGWSWEECLAGFRAIESDQQFSTEPYHGGHGLIPVTRLTSGPLDDAVFDWCRHAGYPEVADHNAPGSLGFGMWPTNLRNGARWGTWAGVVPAARAAGVEIRAETTVTRLIFNGTRCLGAEVSGPDGVERIETDRVVVCAGAFGSPALLMRSGIGPESVLAELGVRPVSALSGVGAALQDHPWCLLEADVADPKMIEARPVSGALFRFEIDEAEAGEEAHLEAEIFQWQIRPSDLASPPTRVAFTAALMVTESRGRFQLAADGAKVEVGLLDNDVDCRRMQEIVRVTADLVDALAEQGCLASPADPWWHQSIDPATLREHAGTYNHHSGTCRMGDPSDPATVVGPDLGVLGTQGLSVADSSILPRIPRANTNLASMMVGWRSPQIIR